MRRNINFSLRMKVSVLFLLQFPVWAGSIFSGDWPMWRGDASNSGYTPEILGLPLTEVWHSQAPLVEENGAVVAGGVVYMCTMDGHLFAFDIATGLEISGFPVTTGQSYGTPVVDLQTGKIYLLAANTLYAINLDGSQAWTKAVGGFGYNFNNGPVIDEGCVYIRAGYQLQKYDASGTKVWSSATLGYETQVSIMGGYVYLQSESGQIKKYDKQTGAEFIGGGFPIPTSSVTAYSALVTVGGAIYYRSDKLYAYRDTGTLIWSQDIGGYDTYIYGSPAVSGSAVYVYGRDGRVYAFDVGTGSPLPGFPSVSLSAGYRNWTTPTIAGDKILIGAGETQKMVVLGAAGTPDAGRVLEEHQTYSADTQGFDLCSPIVSNGWVFAMLDGGGLYAFITGGIQIRGTVLINDDDECSGFPNVTLHSTIEGEQEFSKMRVSEDPLMSGANWEAFSNRKDWVLSPGYGTKTVYVQFGTEDGRVTNVFNDQIDFLESCPVLRRGDFNADGKVQFDDSISILEYLFLDGQGTGCLDAADTDNTGWLEVSDAIGILLWLYLEGKEPAPPGPSNCGPDKTKDSLAPCLYSACP
jgi:outer membrane protein assembly factor BamB